MPVVATTVPSAAHAAHAEPKIKSRIRELNFYYGRAQALKKIDMEIYEHAVTALIGPSGCGKSTLLRCFNRMHDLTPHTRYEGEIRLYPDDVNIVGPEVDPIEVRMRISMVFQKPNPFPKSIYENVAYGLRVRGVKARSELDGRVEAALRGAALWEEVKDRLDEPGTALSGGQQQRVGIARAIVTDPTLIVADEPTGDLDSRSADEILTILELLRSQLGKTIIMVTHDPHAAERSQRVLHLEKGRLVSDSASPQSPVEPPVASAADMFS
jgi:phosphate transport system ATP-binding protein